MTHLEMVEKLRSLTGMSYEEAKAVLERNNWDILDAMVELERAGKTSGAASYETAGRTPYASPAAATPREPRTDGPFRKACKWLWDLAAKSCRNSIAAVRQGKTLLELPILVFIILVCACFWIVVPLMIVGLFFDIRYCFHGPDIHGGVANVVMDTVADTADSIRDKVREKMDESKSDEPKE